MFQLRYFHIFPRTEIWKQLILQLPLASNQMTVFINYWLSQQPILSQTLFQLQVGQPLNPPTADRVAST